MKAGFLNARLAATLKQVPGKCPEVRREPGTMTGKTETQMLGAAALHLGIALPPRMSDRKSVV